MCCMLYILGLDECVSVCDMTDQSIQQGSIMDYHGYSMTLRHPRSTACNDLGCDSCRGGAEYAGHVCSRYVSWNRLASKSTHAHMSGSLVNRLGSCITCGCCRLWLSCQQSSWCSGEYHRLGRQAHDRIELSAQTCIHEHYTLAGNYSWACAGQWQCTVYHCYNCSHCMAQKRALFLQEDMDMSMESDSGPDPYARPPLPRRRPAKSNNQEIVIRPPLPRRRQNPAADSELKPSTPGGRDLEHRQLTEAVEVIAKSAGHKPKARRSGDKRGNRSNLTLREADQARASATHSQQSKEASKTNKKVTPRKSAPLHKQLDGSTNLKRAREDKRKAAAGLVKQAEDIEVYRGGRLQKNCGCAAPGIEVNSKVSQAVPQDSMGVKIESKPATETDSSDS